MTLQGMKLHLLLLAIASSSGYVFFYLASDADSIAFKQNLAHWSRFVIETPAEHSSPVSTQSLQSVPKISVESPHSVDTPILLSGSSNSAMSLSATNLSRVQQNSSQPETVAYSRIEADAQVDNANTRQSTVLENPQMSDSVSNTIADADDNGRTDKLILAFGKNYDYGKENNVFMDTSLLVTKGSQGDATNRALTPGTAPSSRSSETDAQSSLLRSETTAGLISPGESFVGEINLAARAYISNTLEFHYQMKVGFVVETPDTEVMIYALASSIEDYGVVPPNLPPTFQVYDAAGQLVVSSADAISTLDQSGDPAVVHVFAPGAYQVVVSAAKGSAGEVVVGIKDYYSVQIE